MKICKHENVTCINPHEIIRKYRCNACNEVMMCKCEEEFAKRYFPHQIEFAQEYNTRERIPVTLGFQPNICNSCKGLPEEAYPKAEIYGRTTKIVRYYWREILFEKTRRFGEWTKKRGEENWLNAIRKYRNKYKAIEKEVIEDMKKLHKVSPKYSYMEESQNEILTKYKIDVINLSGIYIKQKNGKAKILYNNKAISVEEFASKYFKSKKYDVLITESVPFHVIFGIYIWLLIEDPSDPKIRPAGFGDRNAFDKGIKGQVIWIMFPEDFGTTGYAKRRGNAIKKHFMDFPNNKDELLWLFDYWLEPSANFRQYLWAHRQEDIIKARKIIEILPIDIIIKILKYLISDYWGRYCGWPDLLISKKTDFLFVEVKSSRDKLSEDQKKWIKGNAEIMKLPFKLLKINKERIIKDI